MTMCDEVLADLSRPKKRVLGFTPSQVEPLSGGKQRVYSGKRAAERCYKAIRGATRYVVGDDLLAFLVPFCTDINGRRLTEAIAESRLPHPAVWIEWNEVKRQTLMRKYAKETGRLTIFAPLDDIMPHAGYLLTEEGSEDDPTWMGQVFVNSDNPPEGVSDKTCLAPLGFCVHPNMDSPLRDALQVTMNGDKAWTKVRCRDGFEHLSTDLLIASAAIGKGHLQDLRNWQDEKSRVDVYSGLSAVQSYASEWMDQSRAGLWPNLSDDLMNGDARFLVCLLSVLNYDWILKDDVDVKSAVRRMRRGKVLPRSSHVTLRIDLPKMRGVTMLPTAPVDGASRRQHEVRGHWRRYRKTGKRVWVRSHKRGDATLGVITKDYILDAA